MRTSENTTLPPPEIKSARIPAFRCIALTSLHEVGKILVIAIIRQVTHIQPVLSLADLGVSLGLGSRRIHRPTDTLLPVLSGRTIPT